MRPDMSPEMSTDDGPLLIRGRSRRARLVSRGALREFLDQVTRRVARGRGVVCLITNDGELRRLNRQFLRKDYATDVLSFPAGDGVADGRDSRALHSVSPQLGEIAISIERAAAQAKEHGHSLADELRILMLHGVLHLAGFDHETDSGKMRDTETRWRKRFGLPLGLIERETAGVIRPMAQRMARPTLRSKNGRARP
jgi:probable rRNA maturation factor